MKKLLLFLILSASFTFISCDDNYDGKISDIIKFNTKEIEFDSKGGSKIIVSKGDWWWILDYITINGKSIYMEGNSEITIEKGKAKGWDNPDVIYDEGADMEIKKIQGNWYTITKDSYQSLIIEVNPNTTNAFRSLVLHVEAGNYFDYITINQSANH